MARTIDLNLLPLFVAVAEAASMSEAARRLSTPKSSVSRGVADLEASLGVRLFHRTTRQVSLTTAGNAFYKRAHPLIASLRDISGSIPEQEEEPSGELRITAPVDLGLTLFPELAARFLARYPAVQLDVRLSNRKLDLVAEGIDAAVRASAKLSDSTLVARRLCALEFRLYASPQYLARRGQPRTPKDLGAHDWVLFRGLKALPLMPAPTGARLVSDDLMFVRESIRASIGLGALPSLVAQPDVSSGQLVRVVPRWEQPFGNLFLVYPYTEQAPRKVTAFRDFLLEFLAERTLAEAIPGEGGGDRERG